LIEVWENISEPLQYSFMVRALIVSVLVGVTCAVLGSYVVMRGLAFMGDALAHAVLPGVVIALLIGFSPFAGAAAVGIAVAIAIGYLTRRTGLSEDTTIGILFAGLFALGITILSASDGLSVNLEDLLLGQVLGVSTTDVYVTLGMAVLVLGILTFFHKELVFTSFDPVGAEVIGIPTKFLSYLLLVLLALVIVIALQAVGLILVMAMLVTPAATAFLLVRRFMPMMVVGGVLGGVSAIVGLYLSFYFNIPSGAAMVLVATGLFISATALRRRVV
jgi:ABC-type Mn2+/Zn2+ transport system permease subunit